MLKLCPVLLCLSLCAAAAESSSDDALLTIGRNPKLVELDAARTAELCKTLSGSDDKARANALSLLQKDRVKAAPLLLACLDQKATADPVVRLGALKGLDDLRITGKEVSGGLSVAAVNDGSPDVRKAALTSIKTRADDVAIQGMLGQLMAAFDPLGNVRDNNLHNNAVTALHDLGDKRVYQALLYYVTMELRLTNISEGNLTTRQIDTYSVNNGANFAFPVQLALPIQTPELKVARVQTSVVAPATVAPALSALRSLSGEDFGNDWEKWTRWVEKRK